MFLNVIGMSAQASLPRSNSIGLFDARKALNDRGFTVKLLRVDAWTLSCLSRVTDSSHAQDIYWKSPYNQMLRFIDAAKDIKESRGISNPMPIHLPNIAQLRLIGADGLRRLFEDTKAMKFFAERVIDTQSGIADLSILPLMFDRFKV
ncbi:hypothetical protein HZC34_06560 [Candidatus Saganbacteria bacterium]|nr:hypothetical protein [Candidatus Saganbacteria bacterium]